MSHPSTSGESSASNGAGAATNTVVWYPPGPGTVANISTRGMVQTGANMLIGGFIVTGNAAKEVMVCAIGPSLRDYGVPVSGRLLNPMLELHNGSGALIARNDDWHTTQIGGRITANPNQLAAIQKSGHAPTDSRESAMIVTLPPGSYTARVKGKNGTTGIALVEVYDLGTASLDDANHAQLTNVYTSGLVQTGDNVRIGFIVGGDSPAKAKIIVSAIGPSLAHHGITNPLQDPTLELRDHTGALIARNDNWHTTQIGGRITANPNQ